MFMVRATIGLIVVCVISGFGAALYSTYLYYAAGTVAVAACMIITAISLAVMDVISGLSAALYRAKRTYFICILCLTMMTVS